jgi:hypothetical protein
MLHNRMITGQAVLTKKEYQVIYMLKALHNHQQHEKVKCVNNKKLKRSIRKNNSRQKAAQ